MAKWSFDQYKSAFGVVFWTGGATGVAQAQAAQFCKKLNENPSLSPYITLEGSLIGGFMDRLTNPDKSRLFHNDCGNLLAAKGASHTAVDPGLSRIAQRAVCHDRGYDNQNSDIRRAKFWNALRLPESKKAAFDAAWATRDGWREEHKKLPQRMCYRLTMGTTKTCSRLGGLWGTVSDALAAKTDTSKVIYSIQRAVSGLTCSHRYAQDFANFHTILYIHTHTCIPHSRRWALSTGPRIQTLAVK